MQARDVCIAGHTVSVVESSLSDGLGARLWSVSFMLCRHAPTHETERERERERERGPGWQNGRWKGKPRPDATKRYHYS